MKNSIVVNYLADSEEKVKTIIDKINQLKKTGKNIIYTSLIPIDERIQSIVNFSLYNKENNLVDFQEILDNKVFNSPISNEIKKGFKIKLLHLQTTTNDERETLSRESVKRVCNFGFNYVLHQNEIFSSLPPTHNCLRPHNVRLEKYDNIDDPDYGNALTPAHYGCFDSFKSGIISEFDKDLDFLIVCEGDCIIEAPTEEFVNKVNQVCKIINDEDISYFSFGDTKTLDFGWPQSDVVREIPNQDLLFITNKIIGLQCIMFPIKTREYLINQLRNHKWDCMDTFFNIIFSGKNMGILKNRITTQADGYSLIDKELKTFVKK